MSLNRHSGSAPIETDSNYAHRRQPRAFFLNAGVGLSQSHKSHLLNAKQKEDQGQGFIKQEKKLRNMFRTACQRQGHLIP
jgi:hypothetical protein